MTYDTERVEPPSVGYGREALVGIDPGTAIVFQFQIGRSGLACDEDEDHVARLPGGLHGLGGGVGIFGMAGVEMEHDLVLLCGNLLSLLVAGGKRD